ncbi:MAG: hypothetical protein ABI890_06100 [Lapillicoccus sp.]
MSNRLRLSLLVAICVVLVAATAFVVVRSRSSQQQQLASVPPAPTVLLSQVGTAPRIMFVNMALGPNYGQVAAVPLSDPGGARTLTSVTCDRVFAAAGRTLCLASDKGLVTTYSATVYDDATNVATQIPLTGSPSRARLSDDGLLSATTSFVAGDSYASVGFSTRTVVTRLAGRQSLDLEDFTLVDGGSRISPTDRNYWGVTFASDDDHFYLTVAFGGVTHLARGQLSTRTVETVRPDAECPSLSPDGTRVAYKKRGDRGPGDWRLAVLDIATGRETPLAETHSIDDQVEWLDNDRILYGLPGEGATVAESNVWVVKADGTGTPSILVPRAWSPAVVR